MNTKFFSSGRFVFFSVLAVFVLGVATVFVYRRVNTSLYVDLSKLPNQFPLQENKEGGFDLECVVRNISYQIIKLDDENEIQLAVTCITSQKNEQYPIFVPLVIYNRNISDTAILNRGIYSGPAFSKVALEKAYPQLVVGSTLFISFDDSGDSYGVNDQRSLNRMMSTWLNKHQTDDAIKLFIKNGNTSNLVKMNNLSIVVPFFAKEK